MPFFPIVAQCPSRKAGNPGTNPGTISGLLLWYRADVGAYTDAGVTLATDGQTVQQWNDQSGNGTNASMATGGNRPTWKAAIQNGLPVVRFNGTTSFMTYTGQLVNDFTALFAVSQTGDSALLGSNSTPAPQLRVGQGGLDKLSTNDGGNNPASTTLGVAQGQWSVLEFSRVFGTTTVSWYQNGIAYSTGTMASAQTFSDLGAFLNTPANPLNGDLGEVLLYNSALSTANRQGVEQWLRNRWGTG